MLDSTDIMRAAIERIARVAHEANAALCRAYGDHSQPEWGNAPQWQREASIEGVKFHLSHPTAGPEAGHEKWLEKKKADGWAFGLIKNEETKQPPCMLPFNELSSEQQAKDHLFRQIVHSLK